MEQLSKCIEQIKRDANSPLDYGRCTSFCIVDTFNGLEGHPKLQTRLIKTRRNNIEQFKAVIEIEPKMDAKMFRLVKKNFEEDWMCDNSWDKRPKEFVITSERMKKLILNDKLTSYDMEIAYKQ
jgi:hypothetical protein